MKLSDLILIGGGGHCKSVIDVAESAGYTISGILDMPEKVGEKILDYKIIGTDDLIPEFINQALFVITIGYIKDTSLRIRLHEKIVTLGGELATIIASSAYVSRYAKIGKGTVVMHNSMVNANAIIGEGCIINTFSNIEHDSYIGDFCHISTGAIVNGGCTIGKRTFLGSQSVMNHGVSIGDDCIIAAGSVVRKNIGIKGIYSGNPASIKKKL
jgi:sugar O-acyltransferase (sialic acid O-acetyltransferase NeuD family)